MNVKRIRMQGFRSYADCDLELPAGTVGVVGANGAGKSTLMEAVCFGLFGPEGRSVGPYITEGADRMLVELWVEHSGDVFRIRRSATATKTALDFDLCLSLGNPMGPPGAPAQWEPLTQGNQKDTQARIEQTLGVNRATFLNSVFLRQNEGGNFAKADPKARRELLADALGLDVYDRAHDLVSTDRRNAERRAAELDGRIAVLASRLDELDAITAQASDASARVNTLATELADREKQLSDANATVAKIIADGAAWREQSLRVQAADNLVDRARTAQEIAREAREAADRERLAIAGIQAEADELDDLTQRLAGAEAQQRLHDEAVTRRQRFLEIAEQADTVATDARRLKEDALARLDEIDQAERPTCGTCGQHVEGDALQQARQAAKDQAEHHASAELAASTKAQANRDAADSVNMPNAPAAATVQALRTRATELHDAPARLAAARERLAAFERQAQPMDTRTVDLWEKDAIDEHARLAAIPAPDDAALEHATHHANTLDYAVKTTRISIDNARTKAAELNATVAALSMQKNGHDAAFVARADLNGVLEELRLLDQAFGPAGVPAWIVEHNAIPAIEQHANHVLDRLGGAVRRVELRTERETQKGEARATLDVVCHTDSGAREFSTFSGGEQTRADLAIRLGLASLLSARSQDVRLLCLDEPSGLDASGMEALVDVLREMTVSGRVDTVLLASHVPALRDAFDTALVVEKRDGRSRVAVA